MGLIENRDPPLPSMGSLPSQSQFDDSYVSSGPTETQKSLEEGGEGDFTVAIPGMASSQVDVCNPSLPLVLALHKVFAFLFSLLNILLTSLYRIRLYRKVQARKQSLILLLTETGGQLWRHKLRQVLL